MPVLCASLKYSCWARLFKLFYFRGPARADLYSVQNYYGHCLTQKRKMEPVHHKFEQQRLHISLERSLKWRSRADATKFDITVQERTLETPWAHPGCGWLQTTRESIPGPVHSHTFCTFNSQISNDTCQIQKYKYLDIIYAPSIHYITTDKNKSCMQILRQYIEATKADY